MDFARCAARNGEGRKEGRKDGSKRASRREGRSGRERGFDHRRPFLRFRQLGRHRAPKFRLHWQKNNRAHGPRHRAPPPACPPEAEYRVIIQPHVGLRQPSRSGIGGTSSSFRVDCFLGLLDHVGCMRWRGE